MIGVGQQESVGQKTAAAAGYGFQTLAKEVRAQVGKLY
jgi:hypothetical protein